MLSERVSSIDAFKAFAAFYVVCIHIKFFGSIGTAMDIAARVAVPYFFLVTGFFIWDADSEVIKRRLKKSFKNILFLVFISNLLFLIWNVLFRTDTTKEMYEYFASVMTLNNLQKLFVLNISPFVGHLWYLNAILYVLIIYYFINKFNLYKLAYVMIPLLLICNLILDLHSEFFFGAKLNYIYARNFLFFGFPYTFIGTYIREKVDFSKTYYSNSSLLLAYLVFTCASIFEYFIGGKSDNYLFTTFAVISIFLFAQQNPKLFFGTYIEKIGKEYSLIIYIIHPIFIQIFGKLIHILRVETIYSFVAPIVVYVVSLFAAVFIKKLTQIIYYRGSYQNRNSRQAFDKNRHR